MIVFLNAGGVAIGIALMIKGVWMEDMLRVGLGVLLVAIYLVKLVREGCDGSEN